MSLKTIIASLSLIVSGAAMSAPINVEVVWPFAIGGDHGNLIRAVVDDANQRQQKYKFVLVNKPGAGGAVATNSVIDSNKLIILAHAPAVWTRPLLFKEGRYDVNKLTPISIACYNDPAVLVSKKFNTTKEMLEAKQLTVGINPGSMTSLVAGAAFKNTNQKITFVPYKNTIEITAAVMGGHIDVGVDFLVGVVGKPVTILGVTGTADRNGIKTFESQGLPGLTDIANTYFFLVKSDTNKNTIRELSEIFIPAGQSKNAERDCGRLYASTFKGDYNETVNRYDALKSTFTNLIKELNLEVK